MVNSDQSDEKTEAEFGVAEAGPEGSDAVPDSGNLDDGGDDGGCGDGASHSMARHPPTISR